MSNTNHAPHNTSDNALPGWNHLPQLPIPNFPLFDWPPNPMRFARWFARAWLALTPRVLVLAIALVSWYWFHPAIEGCREFSFDWIAQVLARNFALLIIVAGGLHLYFYTWRRQGARLQFDARPMARDKSAFLFRDQVRDNMFWSLASGVPIWSAYEILLMWSHANGLAPLLLWGDNPIWFIVLILLTPVWTSFHFYWIHRLLHWQPLYRRFHALHHRNINIGPWSGISMHPVEHVIYLSSIAIHWLIATHPIHMLFHMQYQVLNAAAAHCGFAGIAVKDQNRLPLGNFFHQLHHRYFDCNYGNAEMPWDKWFGSFHDGTQESHRRVLGERR